MTRANRMNRHQTNRIDTQTQILKKGAKRAKRRKRRNSNKQRWIKQTKQQNNASRRNEYKKQLRPEMKQLSKSRECTNQYDLLLEKRGSVCVKCSLEYKPDPYRQQLPAQALNGLSTWTEADHWHIYPPHQIAKWYWKKHNCNESSIGQRTKHRSENKAQKK
jgi:hypothetical protein